MYCCNTLVQKELVGREGTFDVVVHNSSKWFWRCKVSTRQSLPNTYNPTKMKNLSFWEKQERGGLFTRDSMYLQPQWTPILTSPHLVVSPQTD